MYHIISPLPPLAFLHALDFCMKETKDFDVPLTAMSLFVSQHVAKLPFD
jgi:hypothetical protein